MSTYPKDLIPLIKHRWEDFRKLWPRPPRALPPSAELEMLLDAAFHASFLTEETRRPGFRIIYYSSQEYAKDYGEIILSYRPLRVLPLDYAIPCTASEINRLAPAAELTRLIMCVTNVSGDPKTCDLRIWGMLDVGENWWKFIHHEAHGGQPPPSCLTITSTGPGELSLSIAGNVLLTLKNGQVLYPTDQALWKGPVAGFLAEARQQLYRDTLNSLGLSAWDQDGHDEDYPLRFYSFFLERVLFYVRQKQHGGILIIIPCRIAKSDTRITDWINIKYECSYNYAWDIMVKSLVNHRKYYDLYFSLSGGTKKLTRALFREYSHLRMDMEEDEEALSDAAQAIAVLTSVDGAVLMTDRFNVIGFGAEVTAISPSLREIVVATIPKNKKTSIESYGTRHRAAFRFCSNLEDSIAFVVSSDGGVKAVKRVGADVFLWPGIDAGSMGL